MRGLIAIEIFKNEEFDADGKIVTARLSQSKDHESYDFLVVDELG